MTSKARYVGQRAFYDIELARAFCVKHGLSWTLIHHKPYKHKLTDNLAG